MSFKLRFELNKYFSSCIQLLFCQMLDWLYHVVTFVRDPDPSKVTVSSTSSLNNHPFSLRHHQPRCPRSVICSNLQNCPRCTSYTCDRCCFPSGPTHACTEPPRVVWLAQNNTWEDGAADWLKTRLFRECYWLQKKLCMWSTGWQNQ